MIPTEAVQNAQFWYEEGVKRIESGSISLGITSLEKAIALFAEEDNPRVLTYARHHKLLGLKLDRRYEEAESQFADVMQGYTQLEDSYGKGLLLAHLAECLAAQGRWERAEAVFHLASVVAENDQHKQLLAYIRLQQGQLCRQRDDLARAERMFQAAERLCNAEQTLLTYAQCRWLRAEALSRLGETTQAVALLEDVHTQLIRAKQFRDALEPLTLLKQLHEDMGMEEDKHRIARLIHLCGQQILRTDDVRREKAYLGPSISRQG